MNRFIALSNTAVQNFNSVVGNGELAHKKVGIWRKRLRTPGLYQVSAWNIKCLQENNIRQCGRVVTV